MNEKEKAPLWCSARFSLAIVGFFGFVNLYAQRVNLSVALVCMLNHSALEQSRAVRNVSLLDESCGPKDSAAQKIDGPFIWSKQRQGLILGAFFWGYMMTQVTGGLLSQRFGGKRVFLYHMLVSAVCSLLCPLAASIHYILFVALRIIIGIGEGVAYPSMHTMWSHWSPPLERSILVGFTYAGAQIGNVITFPLSGLACDVAGWPSVFYLFGGLGLVWCLAWLVLVSDKPSLHGRISEREKEFIEYSLIGQMDEGKRKSPIPWGSILKSAPVWAIIVSHTAANFGTYLVLTTLPTYMSEVLNMDIKSNGLYSAFPYIAYFLAINLSSNLADFIRRNRWLSTTSVRKIMMLFSLCGQSAFLIATGYLSCDQAMLAIIFFTLAQGISGFQYAGFAVNHIDIAPKYAGTLFGLSNTFATVSGIAAPYIAAVLTADQTLVQWRSVFYVAAGILNFGAIFYAIFGSGELQPWAAVHSSNSQPQIEMVDLKNGADESLLSK